jgi:hypothetical protein
MLTSLVIAADDATKLREYLSAYGANNTLLESNCDPDELQRVLVPLSGDIWIGALVSALGAALEGYFAARASVPGARLRIELGSTCIDARADTVREVRQQLEMILTNPSCRLSRPRHL